MAYTTIDNPELYFQIELWTGTGSENARTLDGDTNMQPDLVWTKSRSDTHTHMLWDAVRGATKRVESSNTDAESTAAQGVKSFDSDGFTLGTDNGVNESSEPYIAWCWKANGSGSSDTTGTINSTGTSANTTAGFSIVKYSSGGSTGTVGHGLGSVPKAMCYKPLSTSGGWDIYHHSLGIGNRIHFHNNYAASSGYFQTLPTSSVFTEPNLYSGEDVLMYCFAEKQGFNKFGSYTGNGNANGAFIYTGFRPAFFMCKNTATTDQWCLVDNKRGVNGAIGILFTESTAAENATETGVELLSNGIKIRTTGGFVNGSGNKIVYWAFAEAPFVNSEGVPCNAR